MAGMRYQPQGLLRIDQGSPLAALLRIAILPGVNRSMDAASQRAIVATGTKQVYVPSGLAASFSGTVDKIVTAFSGALQSARTYLFGGRRNGAGGGGLGRLFDKTSGTTGQFFCWYGTYADLMYGFYTTSLPNGGGTLSERNVLLNSGSLAGIGRDFVVRLEHIYDGAGSSVINAWINDTPVLTNYVVSGYLLDAPGIPLTIGNRNSDNARGWDGLIDSANVWDRTLGGGDSSALKANRYQMFADANEDENIVLASSVLGASLTGSAVAQAVAVGALTTSIPLSGSAAVLASGSATLSTSVALAGAAFSVSSADASLTTAILLQGSAAASPSASGALASGGIGLTGAAVAQASGSAVLSTAIALKGTAAADASASAMLSTSIALTGVATAVASAVAAMVEGGSAAPGGPIFDVSKISPDRIVVFDGSGSRVVVFEGSGSRVVVFEGSGSRVRINQMSAIVPVKVGTKWTANRDPDEESWYAADITNELADRNTAPIDGDNAVELVLNGVALLDGPSLQVETVDGVPRTYVVALLGGTGDDPPTVWNWAARVRCKNGERFDKTTWFNRVDT